MSTSFNAISKVFLTLLFLVSGTVGTVSTGYAQVGEGSHYSVRAASPTAPLGTQKWRDRSDELPGISSGKSLLLIGAVGAGVITTALVLRSKKKKKQRERKARFQADSTASLSSVYGTPASKSFQERLIDAQRQTPVNVFLGLGRQGPVTSKDAVVVGVSLKF